MLSLLSSSLWTGSWRDVVRGLMLYGVPTAALVSLCGLAAWRYKHRRQEQVSSLQDPSSLQRIPPAAGSGMSETDGGKATRGAGTDHQFSDSGYVESTSFISTSTSTPVLPKQLVDDMRSPDGRYPPPSNSQQQQQPPAQPSEPPVVVAPPSYSTAPVDLRIPRSRATIQLPIDVVGRFIGRQGRNIKSLMAESGSQIHVQQKNLSRDATMVPCVLQGTNPQINKAIDLILLRHPEVVIPPIPTVFSQLPPSPINPVVDITTNSSDGTHPIPPVNQLTAAETNWDYTLKPHVIPDSPFLAIATYIEKLNRIWLVPYSSTQQLDELHQAMTLAYSKRKVHPPPPSSLDSGVSIPTNDLPPEDIVGKYCAVRVSEVYWLRGRVNTMRCDEGTDYEVKLMDYGSSVIVPPTAIKPLRKEHTLLSIQAFPCILANVVPINNDNDDGMVVLQALVEGTVLEVHTPGPKVKDADIAPLVELYVHQYGSEVKAFVNREVINQGFAVWRESTLIPPFTASSASAVGSKSEPVAHSKIDQAAHSNEPTSKNTCSLEKKQNDADPEKVKVGETVSSNAV